MALELPSYAIPAFDCLDLPWPGIDEDQLRAWAASVRTFADEMSDSSRRVRQAVADLADSSRSSFTSALAMRCEQQSQLVTGLNGPLSDFAAALDTAASQAVAQKQVVINAATELASQFTAAQAPSVTTPGAKQAAQTQQIAQARQTVSAALESLEADLSGPLLNVAVPQVTDYLNGFVGKLRDDTLAAAGDAQSLRLTYRSLHETAQKIRGQATTTDKDGEAAYSHNANRNLRDQSGDVGDPTGDGGSWQSVLRLVEQALGDVASVLFTITSDAISHYQRVSANALDKFADEVRAADDSQRARHPDHTTARESELTFKIAERAGAKAAKEFQDGKITDAQFFALLRAHDYDPGWQTGAMRTLGSNGLSYFASGHVPPAPAGQPADANVQALAFAVAAAMAHGVTFPMPKGDPGWQPEDVTLLAPLLRYANFTPQVLANLGAEVMNGSYDPQANAVWSALAANPKAAALFVQQNASAIPDFVSAGNPDGVRNDQLNEFLAVLRAGTIGAKGAGPQFGPEAVSDLVTAVSENPDAHALSQVQALYGDIIQAYWPDLNYAVTNPSTLGGQSLDKMSLTMQEWAPFVDEAMRNPKTAATILALAHAQAYQYLQMQGELPVDQNQGNEYAADAGAVYGYFDYQALKVYNQLNSESANANSWKSTLLDDVVNAAILLAPGPEYSIPETLGADFILPMINQVLNAPTGSAKPSVPSLQSIREEVAIAYYNEVTSANSPSSPALQRLVKSAQEQNPPFLVNGKMPSLASLKKSPAQEKSFINWLNENSGVIDPVAQAAQNEYLSITAELG